ncbi:MAG TPA: hypothetical protein HA268_04050 [Candidatus Poseidoniaceae archaeon]|nr:hypothetical protein [Candidatus Poseidoniaceae archaeon]
MFVTVSLASANAAAEEGKSSSDDTESFNLAGYVILGLALIGWGFFLFLLGSAIYQIVRKSKSPYVPINPVKCK